ncbi:MAG: methyltransferase, partial [Capsulimonas sp.]
QGWMWQTVWREGGKIHMGFGLAGALREAGLVVERVRAEAVVQTPEAHFPIEPIVRAMLSRIVAHGVATEEEIDIDTLEQRLSDEFESANATYIGDMVFGAWARKPLDAPAHA